MHRLKITIDDKQFFGTSIREKPETLEELVTILEEIVAFAKACEVEDKELF